LSEVVVFSLERQNILTLGKQIGFQLFIKIFMARDVNKS
jgi:hypothetical protein